MSEPALDLSCVDKFYGDFQAVSDLNWSVPAGSIYGILGPNGAGKTTIIRMILEIIRPTCGEIRVLGESSASVVRNRIGYLPEEKGLYKKMRAWSIIAYFATLKGMSRKAAKARAYELLEKYGLKDFANAKTDTLSKGMGQKVQMLASIAHDPELVILDEPFSGLDPVNQEVMEEMIQDMAKRRRTVIFSTHVMQYAERICDHILLVGKGRKVFDGTIAEAKRTLPRRVRIETTDPVDRLRELEGVLEVESLVGGGLVAPDAEGAGTAPTRWELRIAERADPQSILQECFSRGIRLRSFELSDPSLHEVFVHLVGADAKEASFR